MARRPTQAADAAHENEQVADTAHENAQAEANVVEPTAVSVRLRDNYPQDSYGRIGRRFNKVTETIIPMTELTGEQVLLLEQDVWLETTYLTE